MARSAIVRPPSATFARGLTSASLGAPDLERALAQHEGYRDALERCGTRLIALEPDLDFPDSTFVEDTAVIVPGGAILARPGAPSRRGEVAAVRLVLERLVPWLRAIEPPGTLDGGDVCEAGSHYFIGISERTNRAGADQLARLLAERGATASPVDIRGVGELLHLKTGLAALDRGRLVVSAALAGHPAFADFEILEVPADESYGANCVLVNDHVLVPAGCERLAARLEGLGYAAIALDVSEFRKMDGGLSCLSLRLESP